MLNDLNECVFLYAVQMDLMCMLSDFLKKYFPHRFLQISRHVLFCGRLSSFVPFVLL